MLETITNLMPIVIFFVLLVLGFVFGRAAESKHYKRIIQREDWLRDIVVLPIAKVPESDAKLRGELVTGSVVISVDYFKTTVAALRNLVGGNISAYESLLDRGRREAIIRMQEQAKSRGASKIINLKFETSRISGNAGKGLGSIEVLAYGTALHE